MTDRRFVLWSSRAGDVQVGSPRDRLIQVNRNMRVGLIRISLAFQDALTPAIGEAAAALRRFAKAINTPGPTGGTAPGRPGS